MYESTSEFLIRPAGKVGVKKPLNCGITGEKSRGVIRVAEKKRPGVMLYFEMRPSLRRLSLEEKGLLLESILDYAEHGQLPQFEGMLGMAWDFIQPRVDRDEERYERIRDVRRRAAQKRWEEPEEETQEDANADFAMQTMPTTTTNATANTNTNSDSDTKTNTDSDLIQAVPAAGRGRSPEMDWEDLRRRKIEQLSGLLPGARSAAAADAKPPGWPGGR